MKNCVIQLKGYIVQILYVTALGHRIYVLFCDSAFKDKRFNFLLFLFSVHFNVSRGTNTRWNLTVAVAHVCRRAAFSPHRTTRPTLLMSVLSFLSSLFMKHNVICFTVAYYQNYLGSILCLYLPLNWLSHSSKPYYFDWRMTCL